MIATCMVAAPVTRRVQGSWVTSAADFLRLETDWTGLFERAGEDNIFLTFAWLSTWWKHFAKGELAIITVRNENGCLVAVAPFYIFRTRSGLGARRLGFLADDHVGSDYLDILADPAYLDLAIPEIAQHLVATPRRWDYMELSDTAESPIAAALSAELTIHGFRRDEATRRVCHYISLPPDFDTYLSTLSTSLRCNYRRRWRQLQRDHQATCVTVSTSAEVERHFPSLLALHRMRFVQRAEDSAFLAPGVPEFHVDAMRALAAQGAVRLLLLQAAGETVSAIYGFAAGRTFQFYQCGMHTDWLRHGVGQILIGNAIEQAIAAGHTTFDFLRGDESYKTQWTGQSRSTVTLRFFDRRPASVMARVGLKASATVRAAARRVRARLQARH